MKILIITMFYTPLNNIASYRIHGWVRFLNKKNVDVDVITRHYDLKYLKGEYENLPTLPCNINSSFYNKKNIYYTNYSQNNNLRRIFNYLPKGIKSIYSYLNVDIFNYGWKEYVFKTCELLIKKKKYDFIIGSYGPPISIKLTKLLSEKYKIPYIIDFRDLYFTEKDNWWHFRFKRFNLNNLLNNSSAIIFATKGMQDYFNERLNNNFIKKKQFVIYNGAEFVNYNKLNTLALDKSVIKKFYEIKSMADIIMVHTGTIYKGQNFIFFINLIEQYNLRYKKNIMLIELGNPNSNDFKSKFLYKLPRVTKKTSLFIQQQSDILVLPIWDGRYTGWSGKVFEYALSGKIVMTSPNPQNDLLPFFSKTNNIITANNIEHGISLLHLYINKRIIPEKISTKYEIFTKDYWSNVLYQSLKSISNN